MSCQRFEYLEKRNINAVLILTIVLSSDRKTIDTWPDQQW